jgi:hypothetical protein
MLRIVGGLDGEVEDAHLHVATVARLLDAKISWWS